MKNDEDSIWSWLFAIVLGVIIATAFMGWPVIAWKILLSVFK
jgi:hypothetical protein